MQLEKPQAEKAGRREAFKERNTKAEESQLAEESRKEGVGALAQKQQVEEERQRRLEEQQVEGRARPWRARRRRQAPQVLERPQRARWRQQQHFLAE